MRYFQWSKSRSDTLHLWQLPEFRLAILIPLVVSLVCTLIILIHEELSWDLSAHGFNTFAALFKVPIGILALIIPLIAMVASNHRSVQAAAQITSQRAHNDFVNYYKHLEEFDKYLAERLNKVVDGIDVNVRRHLHGLVYPGARKGDYAFNMHLLSEIRHFQCKIVEIGEGVQSEGSSLLEPEHPLGKLVLQIGNRWLTQLLWPTGRTTFSTPTEAAKALWKQATMLSFSYAFSESYRDQIVADIFNAPIFLERGNAIDWRAHRDRAFERIHEVPEDS